MSLLNPWIFLALVPLFFLFHSINKHQRIPHIFLLFASSFFILLALARPVILNTPTKQKVHAHEYIIALDASYSMQANDIFPSRFDAAKKAIKQLLQTHPKDRFTLFVFTSNTLLISPPTTDFSITLHALNALNPHYILTKSTSLKNLFQTVAKIPMQQKKLIIFSDGGEEHNVGELAHIIKQNGIVPYFIATATTRGAALKKGNHYLKNTQGALVVSKINPVLQDLANLTNGKYYIFDKNIIQKLSDDFQDNNTKQIDANVQNYKEYFFIPLSIALILFFLAVTKFFTLFVVIFFTNFLVGQPLHAGILDFYSLLDANNAYKQHHYLKAAHHFGMLDPSVKSYYNTGCAYYKAKKYKKALFYFTQIKTPDPKLKQKIFYNIATTLAQLHRYDQAKHYYKLALSFGFDKDAEENLYRIKRLHTKKNPLQSRKNATQRSKKQKSYQENKDKQTKKTHSSSNRNGSQSSNGGGENKKQKKGSLIHKKNAHPSYTFSYKAYEKINKGYADEKEPW